MWLETAYLADQCMHPMGLQRPECVWQVVERDEVPLSYLPGGITRVRVRVIGYLPVAAAGNDTGSSKPVADQSAQERILWPEQLAAIPQAGAGQQRCCCSMPEGCFQKHVISVQLIVALEGSMHLLANMKTVYDAGQQDVEASNSAADTADGAASFLHDSPADWQPEVRQGCPHYGA